MDIANVKGVGEKRKKALEEMGIYTYADLFSRFPYRYVDLRSPDRIEDFRSQDMVLISGEVLDPPARLYSKNRRRYVRTKVQSGARKIDVIWFADYVVHALTAGESYWFYGRVSKNKRNIMLINPTFEAMDRTRRLQGIMPVYSLGSRMSQGVYAGIVRQALAECSPPSVISGELCAEYGIADYAQALASVHCPSTPEEIAPARDRCALEAFVQLLLAHRINGLTLDRSRSQSYGLPSEILREFFEALPFRATQGQIEAVGQIVSDLRGSVRMNRLVQGDVGCGKTVVALAAVYYAARCGFQSALMAPTEVLCSQHLHTARNLLEPLGVRVGLLTSSVKGRERRALLDGLRMGSIDLLIGTHALLGEGVEFARLQLCICDEQQRFGVAHRSLLEGKGRECDVLVMTATPIPRTVGLALYGSLNVTRISEKPAGRAPVSTGIVTPSKLDDMLRFIRDEALKGHSAYLVCPGIEGEEDSQIATVNEIYESVRTGVFAGIDCAPLHGGMKAAEKECTLERFRRGEIRVLVSTTVVEVGVDAPQATVMCILNAERFGLSQLHQLRGRVGRGRLSGWCFLYTESHSPAALERLTVLKETPDGFELAEKDFELRGSGDLLGSRQSGEQSGLLRSAGLTRELVELGVKIADRMEVNEQTVSRYLRATTTENLHLSRIVLN